MSVKEKASFVFKHRYLIVKRRENLTELERDDLRQMLEYLPGLATLRRFADRIYWLFDTPKDLPPGELPPGGDRSRQSVSVGAEWSRRWSK